MATLPVLAKPSTVFPGLRPFRPGENILFFGREEQTDELLSRLKETRFLAVLGLSGTGKSSLVQAGLVPALQRGNLADSTARWKVAIMKPGLDPLEAIVQALSGALDEPSDDLCSHSRRVALRSGRLGLVDAARIGRESNENLLLVVDQFEELFRFQRDSSARAHEASEFVGLLLAAAHEYPRDWRIYIVLTMRSDYLGECARFTGLAQALNEGQYLTEPMTRNQLKEVIEGPAGLGGVTVDSDLLEELLDKAAGQQDQLPVLQHLLMRMWSVKTGPRLTLAEYNHSLVVGFAYALDRHAEAVLSNFPEAEQRIAGKIFQRLTEKGEENRESRRPTQVNELAGVVGTTEQHVCEVIEKFREEECSFLTSPDRTLTSQSVIDISHESLIRRWDRLRDWATQEAEWGEWYERVEARLRFRGRLLASELDAALTVRKEAGWNQVWAERYRTKKNGGKSYDEVIHFLELELRNRRIMRGVGMIVAVVLIGSAVAVGYFRWSRERAQVERERARRESYWESSKAEQCANHPSESVEWAAEVISADPSGKWRNAILQHVGTTLHKPMLITALPDNDPIVGVMFSKNGRRILTWSNSPPTVESPAGVYAARLWDASTGEERHVFTHGGPVSGAVFNKDESQILTWSADNTARLWDASTGEVRHVFTHGGPVSGAVFDKGQSQILTWSADNTARLWDAHAGNLIGRALQHSDSVLGAALSKDESQILTWSADKTARLWDASTGEVRHVFTHGGPVSGAVFSNDERRILTWSADGRARLWDVHTPQNRPIVFQHEGPVFGAVFSKDERRILTWSADKTAWLWDARTGDQIVPALNHEGSVLGAAFNKNESRILTWSDDRTARLWDVNTGNQLEPTLNHEGSVHGAVFNKDESRILTWGKDGPARLWDAQGIKPTIKHEGSVLGAVFNKDRRKILTWSEDKAARLWEVSTGRQIGPLLKHEGSVRGAIFSKDESEILTWSEDNTVRLWDASTGEKRHVFKHDGPVFGAVFSNDERRILTWSADGWARLWDAITGEKRHAFKHDGPVFGAVFSNDESRILTCSKDGWARLWDASSGEERHAFSHGGPVFGAVFSKDESRILTWSADHKARLFDASSGEERHAFSHGGPVFHAVFNNDESQILTWSEDNKARLFDASSGEERHAFNHDGPVSGAVFSNDESQLLTWSEDSTARLWDARTGRAVAPALHHENVVRGALFSKDGSRILTWSADNTARLWDAQTGEGGLTLQHAGLVGGAAFSTDESQILTWSNDGTVRLWDVAGDYDFPPEHVETWVKAVTGMELNVDSRQLHIIGPKRWREIRAEYDRIAKEHAQHCKYPNVNQWLLSHPPNQ